MEKIIDLITSNSIYLTIAIVICVMLAIALVKKMIKMIIISIIILAIYAAYLSFTGQKIPRTREQTVEHIKSRLEKGEKLLKNEMEKIKLKK